MGGREGGGRGSWDGGQGYETFDDGMTKIGMWGTKAPETSEDLDPMDALLIALLVLNVAGIVTVTILYRRARKAQRERRVEAANSHYKSQYVLDLEAKQRWESLDLSLLHPLNREEVEKVLAKLKATSVRALTSQERIFLDRMVEAERRMKRTERRRRQGLSGPLQGGGDPAGPPPLQGAAT